VPGNAGAFAVAGAARAVISVIIKIKMAAKREKRFKQNASL
jgi:hypothetical protein